MVDGVENDTTNNLVNKFNLLSKVAEKSDSVPLVFFQRDA